MGKKPPQRARPYQVFLSHATADKWLATVLCERLEAVGATAFRDDRDIDGGDDIPESIRNALKRSHEVVVLLTPHSIGRQWVTLEVGAAWALRRDTRITVVMCHVETDPIPAMLKSKKAIDLNKCDEFLQELRLRVAKHHGRQ